MSPSHASITGMPATGWLRHAAVVAGYVILFTWVWARPLVEGGYLAGTDLFDYYLPIFLSPITIWSHFELSGLPAFADSQNAPFYPPNLLFARVLPSWTAYIVSAYVLAATFTYAYVYNRTRSIAAAALAGLCYALSEAMMERLDHLTIVHTIAWLPLVVLALDRLGGRWHAGWVIAGAVAVASAFLAGHTQPAIYITYLTGVYALVSGVVSRARPGYYLAVVVLFAAGGLLSGISSVPLLEASGETVRQSVNFGQFVSHSNTPAQMLSALVPQIAHEGREAPTYVGLGALLLALVALRETRRNWAVPFWWLVAIAALLAGAGEATPVARLLYDLPFYDSFRVVARHLVLAAFALAVLAGFGLAAILQGRASGRVVMAAAVVVAAAVTAAMGAVLRFPERFALESGGDFALSGLASSAVERQALLGVVTILAVLSLLVGRGASRAARSAVLLAVLTVDLLHALPYSVALTGVQAPVVLESAARPSVHADRLRRLAGPGHYRVLAPGGVTVDPVVPGAFARTWQIPVAGAYGAILTPRYAALAMMGTTGAVQDDVLADDSVALDLLSVKYVLVPGRDRRTASEVDVRGIRWSDPPLDLAVGPRECGQRYPRQATYALPPGVEVARVMLVAALRCSDDAPQGAQVGTLAVHGPGGVATTVPLRAGVEISDAAAGLASLQSRARHRPADAFETIDGQQNYLLTFDTPPTTDARLEFTLDGTAGWLRIDRITVTDQAGNVTPVAAHDVLLSNRSRWRPLQTFATSAVSDRGSDEEAAGEQPIALFENHRALPRAWVVREVVPLDERQMTMAIHHSYLPDGRRIDPAAVALIDAGAREAATYPAGDARVAIDSISEGVVRIQVSTTAGGFLVLSESFYPGWRARVGDREVPVYRTNLSLQGVEVPAGTHTVTFSFEPSSLRIGMAASALSLAGLAVLGIAPVVWRRRARPDGTRDSAQTISETRSET